MRRERWIGGSLAASLVALSCSGLLGVGDLTYAVDADSRETSVDVVPEGACAADLESDPQNCGACGHACGPAHGSAACHSGTCVFVCDQGYAHCSANDATGCETSTQADPANCGACGRSCLGQTCTAGLCKPTVLAASQSAPQRLTVDDTAVYWTNAGSTTSSFADGTVMRANKVDGSGPMTLAASHYAAGIAVDATNAYWPSVVDGTVSTVPKMGGAVRVLSATESQPIDVAVDATNVYWVSAGTGMVAATGAVRVIDKAAAMPARTVASGLWDPQGIAVSTTDVFWAASAFGPTFVNGSIGGAQLDGGAARVLSAAVGAVSVAVDVPYVYWANSQPGGDSGILRVEVDGGGSQKLVSGLMNAGWVATDATHVFWSDPGASQIVRAAKDGSGVLVLAAAQKSPHGVAVDGSYVYWINSGTLAASNWYDNHDGAVMKVPK
jgi:hypothetical protein